MKQRLLSFIAVVVILFLAPGTSMGQTITLEPGAVPNGIAQVSGEQYHQRFDPVWWNCYKRTQGNHHHGSRRVECSDQHHYFYR